jgi:predicted DNA-binding transcriptional regulator YafY
VVIPPDVDVDSLVDRYTPSSPQGVAKVLVRPEGGQGLRRRALSATAAEDGWDEVVVMYWDEESFAEELVQYGPDVVAVDPLEVRDTLVARLRLLAEVPA